MANRASTARKAVANRDMAMRRPVPDDRSASMDDDQLQLRLSCPQCGNALAPPAESLLEQEGLPQLSCQTCKSNYPTFACGDAAIPWMYPDPDLAHLEWSARFKGFLQAATNEHNGLNHSLGEASLTDTGRRRISSTLIAKREHRRQVADLLAPFNLDADVMVPAMTELLADSLPRNQHLLSYADNVFRDWAWNNGENAALMNGIEGLFAADSRDSLGSVLTLGAGAGRLAYDVHQQFSPELSVLLDLNPLLLSVGARIIQGQRVSLYEFPIAPLDEDSGAILQKCTAPKHIGLGGAGNFRFVLGDATCPPFAEGSFDTVITPWLIDILPQDLREFVPHLNRLLPEGGLWVNTGSLNFVHDNPCRRYSEKETMELVEQCGFEIVGIDHRTVSYLKSPHSAHGRSERITSFTARKRRDVAKSESTASTPEWMQDTSLSVPVSPETSIASSSHLLTAQVLAAVDGKRSINAITKLVSREYNLSFEECSLAVRRILLGIQK
ncbi:MAG: methyltransferase domain-containing protein [Woeseiaceae bacterium]